VVKPKTAIVGVTLAAGSWCSAGERAGGAAIPDLDGDERGVAAGELDAGVTNVFAADGSYSYTNSRGRTRRASSAGFAVMRG